MPHADPQARRAYHRAYGKRYYEDDERRARRNAAQRTDAAKQRRRAWALAYYADPANRERLLERRRARRQRPESKEKAKAYARARARLMPVEVKCRRNREFNYRHHYGLTSEQVELMVAQQQGRCAICCQPPSGKRHCARLHVDHDHITGKVRSMLCSGCNKALGLVREDIGRLTAMIEYLRRHAEERA